MFLDQYWKPFNTEIDEKYYALVFHINPLVMQVSSRPSSKITLNSVIFCFKRTLIIKQFV